MASIDASGSGKKVSGKVQQSVYSALRAANTAMQSQRGPVPGGSPDKKKAKQDAVMGQTLGEGAQVRELGAILKEELAEVVEDKLVKRFSDIETQLQAVAQATDTGMAELKSEMVSKDEAEQMINASVKTAVDERIKDIEKGLSKTALSSEEGTELIMGGFKNHSFTASSQWIHKVVTPKKIYQKADPKEEFNGLLFMKFSNVADAEEAMRKLNEKAATENDGREWKDRLWVDVTAPIEQRVCIGFLRDLRNQLLEWEDPKKSVSVDPAACIMKVEGKAVVEAKVIDDDLRIVWSEDKWTNWQQLQSAPELNAIIEKAKGRLAKSRAATSKGAGKGLHK